MTVTGVQMYRIATMLMAGEPCLLFIGNTNHPDHFYVNWIRRILYETVTTNDGTLDMLMAGLSIKR
jgi:hypothetical protein